MFGLLPAYGFFIRHAKGIELDNVEVGFLREDRRPAFVLDQVNGASFENVKAQKAPGVSTFVLKNVENFETHRCRPVADMQVERADRREF
jgi:hypothetical protein